MFLTFEKVSSILNDFHQIILKFNKELFWVFTSLNLSLTSHWFDEVLYLILNFKETIYNCQFIAPSEIGETPLKEHA